MIFVATSLEDALLIEPGRREHEGPIILEPVRNHPDFAQPRQQ
jgi:hypothetical protein